MIKMDNKCHKKAHEMGMQHACPMMCCPCMCPMVYNQVMYPMMGMESMNMPMIYPTKDIGHMQCPPYMGTESMNPEPMMKSINPMASKEYNIKEPMNSVDPVAGMEQDIKEPMMDMMGGFKEKDIYGIKMRTVDISEIED